MTPLVSVVIPAYNSARTVGATITSVLAQTMTDVEVLVVDDGSTDGTGEAARGIHDSRVRVLQQENGGVAAARNAGIHAASGEYVGLLDADDLWLPHKLERQLAVLRERPDVHAVHSGTAWVDDDLRILRVRCCQPSSDVLLDTLMFRNMPHNMGTMLVERAMFTEMGMFDTSLTILEEWDMHIKCARHCNIYGIAEPLALYRVHPGNRSRNLDIHVEPGFKVLRRLFLDPDLPDPIRAREQEIYARFYTMLAGGAFKVHRWRDCGRWATRAAVTHPRTLGYMAALPLRRAQRRASRAESAETRAVEEQISGLRVRVAASGLT
jgi:glycosyltransferase involved in cell wall biosynthesis